MCGGRFNGSEFQGTPATVAVFLPTCCKTLPCAPQQNYQRSEQVWKLRELHRGYRPCYTVRQLPCTGWVQRGRSETDFTTLRKTGAGLLSKESSLGTLPLEGLAIRTSYSLKSQTQRSPQKVANAGNSGSSAELGLIPHAKLSEASGARNPQSCREAQTQLNHSWDCFGPKSNMLTEQGS